MTIHKDINIALYQPDMAPNVGAMIRLCACMDAGLDIIEPCGFPWVESKIRKSAMDYIDALKYTRHQSWDKFREDKGGQRLILMTTKGSIPYLDFEFKPGDTLIAGRESSGVPDAVHEQVDGRIFIPMRPGLRSLNIVNATAMILGEALRQTRSTSK